MQKKAFNVLLLLKQLSGSFLGTWPADVWCVQRFFKDALVKSDERMFHLLSIFFMFFLLTFVILFFALLPVPRLLSAILSLFPSFYSLVFAILTLTEPTTFVTVNYCQNV